MRILVAVAWSCVFVLFSIFDVAAAPPTKVPLPGVALKSYRAGIGEGIGSGNLTVFPIYAESNPAFVEAVALDRALARKKARVRELDADDPDLDGAEVGTLVIDNLGKVPIVVLAGTVVKGGKQDRQIGQDFVIAAKSTVDVEAFCVEQGRWEGTRAGKNTGGSFSGGDVLAPSKVRVAAQYESDQGKVWDEVEETNTTSAKQSESGTLMATYDDKELIAKRRALAGKLATRLAAAPDAAQVLGLAYAIGDDIRGVRWFASRGLFEQHSKQLLETMAMESLLAPSVEGEPKRPAAKAVRDFVEGVAGGEVKATKKRPKALNTNVYKESARAYSSEARMEDGTATSAPVTVDISAK